MRFTAETIETKLFSLKPGACRMVTQHRVLLDGGDLYGYAKTAEGAERTCKMLNGEIPMSEEDRARIYS